MNTLHGYIVGGTAEAIQFINASASRMNAEPVTIQRNDIAEWIDLGISPANIKLPGGNVVKASPVTLTMKYGV
jgi:hypothetical protein